MWLKLRMLLEHIVEAIAVLLRHPTSGGYFTSHSEFTRVYAFHFGAGDFDAITELVITGIANSPRAQKRIASRPEWARTLSEASIRFLFSSQNPYRRMGNRQAHTSTPYLIRCSVQDIPEGWPQRQLMADYFNSAFTGVFGGEAPVHFT